MNTKQEGHDGSESFTCVLSPGGTLVRNSGIISAALIECNIRNMEYRRFDL